MAKTKISEFSSTAASNTDIDNINIAEGCSPANVNNAIRSVMAQLKDFQSGNVTYYTSDSDALAVGAGGTGAITAATARTNLSVAKSGANSDITSITGLTTTLSTLQGGTGAIQKAISNVARTSNVVTITTSTAHGFAAGHYVTIAAVTNTSLNGTFLIATVGSTTFTYAQTAADLTSVADTGTVLDITYCNLANNVTGTLPAANLGTVAVSSGGTGATTLSTGNLLVGNATTAVTSVAPSSNGQVLLVTAGTSVTAGLFVIGASYTITAVGTTSFTAIGASANTVGVSFVATGVGTGTGTATLNTWASGSSVKSATSQASTSGTSIDFTSIPSWAKRITVLWSAVSTSGTSVPIIQIGTSSGPTITGYNGTSINSVVGGTLSGATSTIGFPFRSTSGTASLYGSCTISNLNGNNWVCSGVFNDSSSANITISGGVTLGATLDRVRITTTNGTDTFDAGSINIFYE